MNFIDVFVIGSDSTYENGMLANCIHNVDGRLLRIQDRHLNGYICGMTTQMATAVEYSGVLSNSDSIVEFCIDSTWGNDMLAAVVAKRQDGSTVGVDWTGKVLYDCPMISWNPREATDQ